MATTMLKPHRLGRAICTNLHVRHLGPNPDGVVGEWFEVGAIRRMKWQMEAIENIANRVAKSSDPVSHQDKRGYRLTRLGRDLWDVMRGMDEVPESILEGRRLNPLLRVMLPLLRKWHSRLRYWLNPDSGLDVNEDYPRRMMGHVAYVIRRLVRSPGYKAAMSKDRRRAKDRYESCAKYVLDLFEGCSQLLVLRVDLYFEGEGKLLSDSPEARQAFGKLGRDLNDRRIIPGVIGYIDVTEDGLERRLHHHLLVICDGNDHQEGYRFSQAIGNYWVNQCVGSPLLASFKNCWLRRDEYQFNALGVIHYTDTRMLMGLREAIEYMVKDEPHTYLREGYGKGLRKGQSPFLSGARRRGAPRKHGDDLSMAKLVLLTEADPVSEELRIPRSHHFGHK